MLVTFMQHQLGLEHAVFEELKEQVSLGALSLMNWLSDIKVFVLWAETETARVQSTKAKISLFIFKVFIKILFNNYNLSRRNH